MNLDNGPSDITITGNVAEYYDFGGADNYTISPFLSADVVVTDDQASNIYLPAGLEISAALFLSNGVQFTINGHNVTFYGAPQNFTFYFAENPTVNPGEGVPRTFEQTAAAFGTTVPAEGEPANEATQTGEINEDGSVGTSETYALAADVTEVDEGGTVTLTLTTTNVAEGTEVAVDITGIDADDVVGELPTVFVVGADGTATLTIELAEDATTEGPETLTATVAGVPAVNVTVNDTSITPVGPTYALAASATEVDEGGTVTFTLTTTGVAAGASVPVTFSGIDAADVDGTLPTNFVVGADGTATVAVKLLADFTTEGVETLTATVAGAPAVNVTVNDTSTADQKFTLTTALDTITGTASDEVINGVASSLSSENTLNTADRIDGGAGFDSLNVNMKGNFTGFTGGETGGFLKNVEAVNLTNTGTVARTFAAKNVTGVNEYNIIGAVNLSDLAGTDAAVNLDSLASGSIGIDYATDVTKGTSDVLALGLNNVGTVETDTKAEAVVTVTAKGIEELNITAHGDNVVALGADEAKNITVDGGSTLKLTAVGTGLKTFDGSGMAGDLDVDLSEATSVTQFLGGAGNDTIHVVGSDVLTINAQISGGLGDDTLALSGEMGTVQYQMSDVETVEIAGAIMTFSGTYANGLQNVVVKNADNDTDFANLGGIDLAVTLTENAGGKASFDHSGTTTLSVTGGTEDTDNTATINTNLVNSTSVDLVVGQDNTLTGEIVAGKAQSFSADIAGSVQNAIQIGNAISGTFTTGEEASTIAVTAGKMTDLTVTAAGDADLSGSTLGGLERLTVTTAGDFSIGDLGAMNQVSLQGNGSATLGNIGDAELDYGISVIASGLSNSDDVANPPANPNPYALKIGTITTKDQAINVDASDVLGNVIMRTVDAGTGNVTLDFNGTGDAVTLRSGDATTPVITGKVVNINAAGALGDVRIETYYDPTGTGTAYRENAIQAETLNFTGSTLKASFVGALIEKSAVLSGGIQDDTFVLSINNATTETTTITITGGLGDDRFWVADGDVEAASGIGSKSTMEGKAKVTITDFNHGDTTNLSSAQIVTYDDKTEAAKMLVSAGVTGATASNVTLFDGDDGGTAIVYGGNTYFIAAAAKAEGNDDTFDAGEILIKLNGITTWTAEQIDNVFTGTPA